ncbi:oxygen-independent coproporphyrinogen III oxidase [Methylopila jiangsuensis]|uniref:Coproporphyrinogen-III oxidase n=1 Tax=Methylopila jiangsuensis TaxID=586230 RepID=A0A9W6JGJ6_9HYPH|nr:oxygen-independent coproporphyrinogen III oxidase [Methylopila jiangsuensis]MDR6286457.1 oxygen-independent coproporphyrinogen-3 oxidase [Methylopila jiangsuensis]GLK77205.1 oxygen-independent coproporphyrinogen III oxidase [Methylopila jiangsuensis]
MLPLRLSEIAGRAAPRYTSYPTAPQFEAGVDGAVYAGWLEAQAGGNEPASLYLHVPYCRSICSYCGCAAKATRRDEPLIAFAARLRREIALVAERTGPLRVTHLHWGGGTPNVLPNDLFRAILDDIHARFDLEPDAEHAMEIDPRHLTAETVAALMDGGVTRVSLGVQDFDPAVQKAIGRVQPFEMVRTAVEGFRAAGLSGLNMDLIYGLPRQTQASIRDTAARAAALGPDRIALFGYAHVPWMRPHQRLMDEAALPDPALRAELAETARETLIVAGYVPVGIDHFARPDDGLARALAARTLRRNFQGYTTDRAPVLLGFGPTAIGRLPQGHVQNAPDIAGWGRAVDAGRLPVVRGRALTPDDRLRGAVIESLLCFFEADLAALCERHGASLEAFAPALAELEALRRQGFVELADDGRLTIVRDGPALARIVASAFDAYLGSAARHSLAV